MDTHGTNEMEAFSAKALQIFYATSIADRITNSNYEGELKGKGSRMNILTFGEILEKNYTGANLTADDPEESEAQLVTDQQKAFYFKIKSINVFKSYIKNPEGTILMQVANRLKYLIDSYVLGLYGDVAAGHRIGTDYTTGTVTVTDVTGAVTGSGTTFTAAMVGKGFKAAGHDKWYRVKTFTNTTSIVIENDSDDNTSSYDGGTIDAGATYTIEAVTPVQVTKSNIYEKLTSLSARLTNAEIPGDQRWLVVAPEVQALIVNAPEFIPAIPQAYDEVVKRNFVGMIAGFEVFAASDGRLGGNSVDGWHLMAGHKDAITMAMGLTEQGIEDLQGNFGKAYKSLYVYGAKVIDERRKALVELYCKL